MQAISQLLPLLGRHAFVTIPELLTAIVVHLAIVAKVFSNTLLLFRRQALENLCALPNLFASVVGKLSPGTKAGSRLLTLFSRHAVPTLGTPR